MKSPVRTDELTARRVLVVGVFLLVLGATTAMFAQAATGHLASMHASQTEVTVVDYEVGDEGTLDLTLRVHNPTIKDLTLESARMNVYVNGGQVTDGTTSSFDHENTVESGETTEVRVSPGLRDGAAERLRNADPEEITVQGRLRTYVVDKRVDVVIGGMEVAG